LDSGGMSLMWGQAAVICPSMYGLIGGIRCLTPLVGTRVGSLGWGGRTCARTPSCDRGRAWQLQATPERTGLTSPGASPPALEGAKAISAFATACGAPACT